jgi:hypothetical protein
MTASRNPDPIVAAWLEDGPEVLPESTKRAIAVTTRTIRQSRPSTWVPWRSPNVNGLTRLALAVAAVAVAVGGLYFVTRGPNAPGGVAGQPTATPSLAASPTAPATPGVSPVQSSTAVLDTSQWIAYTSKRYGFTISHPAGWEEQPATRSWSVKADTNDWLSPGMEAFVGRGGNGGGIRVAAWAVPLDPGFPNDPTWADVRTWIEGFCQDTNKTPCPRAPLDQAVQLCVERRDCHPGLLVSFESEVQAFFTGGHFPGKMVIVTVWWGEREPATASYGGTRRLLEGFLSTMDVWDAAGDRGAPSSTAP